MSFAAERERRQTAGNRLKRLLDQQDDQEDEFYGTAYGGFVDVRHRSLLSDSLICTTSFSGRGRQ